MSGITVCIAAFRKYSVDSKTKRESGIPVRNTGQVTATSRPPKFIRMSLVEVDRVLGAPSMDYFKAIRLTGYMPFTVENKRTVQAQNPVFLSPPILFIPGLINIIVIRFDLPQYIGSVHSPWLYTGDHLPV